MEHNRPLQRILAKSTRDIILGLFLNRIREDLLGSADFDQPSHAKEGRLFTDSRGLLHVVGHNDDGVILFELKNQIFNACC